jgi:hypothetical protein
VLAAVTGLVAVLAAALVSMFRDRLRLELVAFFALTAACLLGGLHLTEYRSMIAGNGPVIQGRYALPLIALFGLALALVINRLPMRWRGPAVGSIVGGLLVLQVLALATIGRAYYS